MGPTNNPAWRHHYNPEFYLRQFIDPAGKVLRTCLGPDGQLHERSCSPRSLGYEEHLYSLGQERADRPAARSDLIETDILSKVDNDAATAMKKIIADGPSSLGDEERGHWATFVNSLLERHPKKLGERDATASGVTERLRKEFLVNQAGSAENRKRWAKTLLALHVDVVARNAVRVHMVREIRDTTVISYLKGMTWIRVRMNENPELQFLTGDAPLVANVGNPGPVEFLSIALSPQDLLYMHKSDEIPEKTLLDLALLHNLLVLGQSDYIYSRAPLWDGGIVRTRHAAQITLKRVSWRSG